MNHGDSPYGYVNLYLSKKFTGETEDLRVREVLSEGTALYFLEFFNEAREEWLAQLEFSQFDDVMTYCRDKG